MSELLCNGGRVVTAGGSFEAGVLVEDEGITALGTDLSADGAETVDASGRLVIPGFIDAHAGMPFGGTLTTHDWATGPASVYMRGGLLYRDGEIVGEHGSGRFVQWSFTAQDLAVRV